MRILSLTALVSLLVLLAACGGGGGDGNGDDVSRWDSMVWGEDVWGGTAPQKPEESNP